MICRYADEKKLKIRTFDVKSVWSEMLGNRGLRVDDNRVFKKCVLADFDGVDILGTKNPESILKDMIIGCSSSRILCVCVCVCDLVCL